MVIKQLLDEDFINYKKPSMFIGFPSCTWKCEKECGEHCCQNSALAQGPNINVPLDVLIDRYLDNPITKAVVCGGLEPLDSWNDLQCFIMNFRYWSGDDIVIYTGYNEDEVRDKLKWLKLYEPIIVKFGRYIPGHQPHYDKTLGVKLASDNQYAKGFGHMKVSINSNAELVKEIRAKLKENKEKYGEPYCPCVLPNNHNEDTICMCKEFRDQIERGEPGECHCGLYQIVED